MSNKDKDGAAKNLERVQQGLSNMRDEWDEQGKKVDEDLERGNFIAAVHHASGYIEAVWQHPYKLWFYLTMPIWVPIPLVIVGVRAILRVIRG